MQTTHPDSESITSFWRIVMGRTSNECGTLCELLILRVMLGASALVFALVVMSSMALASGTNIDASIEEDLIWQDVI